MSEPKTSKDWYNLWEHEPPTTHLEDFFQQIMDYEREQALTEAAKIARESWPLIMGDLGHHTAADNIIALRDQKKG